VQVAPNARINDLAAIMPRCLDGLERDGIEHLPPSPDPAWPEKLRERGAIRCRSYPPPSNHRGGFSFRAPSTSAQAIPADEMVGLCVEFLAGQPDVASKLAASGLSERHAVVVVTADWLDWFVALADGGLPTSPPTSQTG
jgi:hypothetical protein